MSKNLKVFKVKNSDPKLPNTNQDKFNLNESWRTGESENNFSDYLAVENTLKKDKKKRIPKMKKMFSKIK